MPTAVSHAIPTSVIPALAAGISIRSARPRCCGFSVDRVPARYPRRSGDPCITPFLPQQGEVPKAEGVLLHQGLSGTRAGRTPLYLRCRPGNKCFPGRSVVR